MAGVRTNPFAIALMLIPLLSGCGVVPPKLTEGLEAQDLAPEMELEIKRKILCELNAGINAVNITKTNFGPMIPPSYSVQLQLTLQVAESSSFNPSLTYDRTYRSGSQSGVTIGRNFGLGLSATASSTATRIDTSYTYWRVSSIIAPDTKKNFCDDWKADPHASSPLLVSDLGIARFLKDTAKAANILPSSKPGAKKPDKIDVFSYDLKFAVVTGGGISPTFKLVSLSGAGSPILDLNRTRTHEMLLTFGPTDPDGLQPSVISITQHQNSALNATLSRQP